MRTSSRSRTALVVSIVVAGLAPALAKDEPRKEMGIEIGVAQGDEVFTGPKYDGHANWAVGLRGGIFFTDQLEWFLDGHILPYKSELYSSRVEEQALRTGVEWVMAPEWSWRPFVDLGVGLAHYKPGSEDDFNRGFGSLGIGVRGMVGDNMGLRFELRGDQTFDESGPAPLRTEDFTTYKLMAGLQWGVGSPPKDTDADGVPDRRDDCPNTPRGCTVNQHGCEGDGDGDGVCDGLDRCPDTPAGWPVDATGCSRDSDGDGVADGADKCASTPKGCKVDPSGCPTDGDGDGVCDGLDRCEGTTRGCKVDSSGCPLDGDRDGVCDGLDKCPATATGDKVDASGCTVATPPPEIAFAPKEVLTLQGALFDYNSDALRPEARETLDKVARGLASRPEVRIEIGGHTDGKGGAAYNQKLSERRARAVKDYLVSKGVSASQLTVKGYGKTKPVADNKTQEGRARNRRVELTRKDQ